MRTLRLAGNPLASAGRQLELLASTGVPSFEELLKRHGLLPFETALTMGVLQVNVGKLCNQTCGHCHVDAGPDRRESMTRATAEKVIALLERHPIPTLDITGGAPEMNPSFGFLVTEARRLGRLVMDRCNLTILLMNGYESLPDFLAATRVEIVASLPSFRQAGTDAQRGEGVFEKSIRAMQLLNRLGYGKGGALELNLVHNPVGAFLPGSQASIERDYRRELASRHGVVFDNLYTITNMPISRFLDYLETSGNLQRYMELLVQSFNPAAAQEVMCRSYVSVGWDGTIYDCDFNQMLELPAGDVEPLTLDTLLESGELRRTINTARHCFGCTAGAGSSCGGTVAGG